MKVECIRNCSLKCASHIPSSVPEAQNVVTVLMMDIFLNLLPFGGGGVASLHQQEFNSFTIS